MAGMPGLIVSSRWSMVQTADAYTFYQGIPGRRISGIPNYMLTGIIDE
jgi:hypothetical protein